MNARIAKKMLSKKRFGRYSVSQLKQARRIRVQYYRRGITCEYIHYRIEQTRTFLHNLPEESKNALCWAFGLPRAYIFGE